MLRLTLLIAALALTGCGDTVQAPPTPLAVGGTGYWLETTATDIADPASKVWRAAPAYAIDLALAPPVHPSVQLRHQMDTPPRSITLQMARTSERLFLRLRWPDTSPDRNTSRSDFADAAAVQFPLAGAESTSFMMGGGDRAVNLWYWRADLEQPQNLAAAGFGSTTLLQRGSLAAQSTHDGQEWTLVLSRALAEAGEMQADLKESAAIALALWDGAGEQRDGLKHVTLGWIHLAPQPQT